MPICGQGVPARRGAAANLSRRTGAIAQLAERLHGMQEVGGSNPPGSTGKALVRAQKRLPGV